MGKILIIVGGIIVIIGVLWAACEKMPFFGRLPGDIFVQKKNFTFYFPLATSLIVSALLSLILWLFSKK